MSGFDLERTVTSPAPPKAFSSLDLALQQFALARLAYTAPT